MNIVQILFLFVVFGLVKAMILHEADPDAVVFPEFEEPSLVPDSIPGGCGGFADCIEFVGEIITVLVQSILFIALFLYALVVYMLELIVLLATSSFVGVDGAPAWLNAMLTLPFAAALGFIIYKSLRKGDTQA